MNNEPYGWHCFIGKGKEEQDFLFINGKGASKPDASWDKVIPLYTHPVKELEPKIRRACKKCIEQQSEIDFLKKEILAKHEDWKHEGQQAANARAEIEALTKESLTMLRQQQAEIEALKAHPVKELTYEDGIEECAQRAEFYAYMREQY